MLGKAETLFRKEESTWIFTSTKANQLESSYKCAVFAAGEWKLKQLGYQIPAFQTCSLFSATK